MGKKQPVSRQQWGRQSTNLPQVNLAQVQIDSYNKFLKDGIRESLEEINPIEDFTGQQFQLEFVDHYVGNPPFSPDECIRKGISFEAPLKVKATLTNLQSGSKKTQEVFLGDVPLMTARGTFIVNGVERVVVNQLVRSPGAFFTGSVDPNSGRNLYAAEIRPMRGSWLEFEVNKNDHVTVKIDRSRKMSVVTFLRALGYSTEDEIRAMFKDVDTDADHQYIEASIMKDSTRTTDEALIEFYLKMRPGEPAVLDNAKQLLHQMFFNNRRYNLDVVGRYKMNKRLGVSSPIDEEHTALMKDDVVAVIRYLITLQNGKGRTDDIDHLSNRRVRQVGELVAQGPFRIGLLRLERSIKEKMSLVKPEEVVTPSVLVNARPIIAAVSEFFRRNKLSSILDMVNPLSEIDNLRRLSVMGTGGVSRERASFSMRDIHTSQYSRICPIRSPEGQNIGLVTYLTLYSRVNPYGFIEAPYLKVVPETVGGKTRMKVTDEVVYLTADDEEDFYLTHADLKRDGDYLVDSWVPARFKGKYTEVDAEKIQYIDIIPRQVVGTSASLIPFLQHDDGTRALMGTHMQCQAVPLVKPETPIVGTGMEKMIAESMGWVIVSPCDALVASADADHVTLEVKDKKDLESLGDLTKLSNLQEVKLEKNGVTFMTRTFMRSPQMTCYSQRVVVVPGQQVKKGDVLVDGPAGDNGELAIGQNLVVAYANFEGLGFEDAIVVSDRLLKHDLLSSIHINEYEAKLMDTKLGPEELTRDIPNVAEADLKNLAEDGIVAIGSFVGPNDILVGKIAPKGETELNAEERLLRAIFGDKAREVRDTSLRMPHGDQGTVIDVQILDRSEGEELDPGVIKHIKIKVAQLRKITVGDKLAGRHGNKGVISKVMRAADMPTLPDGTPVDIIISFLSVLARMNLGQLLEAQLGWAAQKLGYTVGVPVFERISEDRINEEMVKAGLPVSGKVRLTDGRTGLPFDEETAVGVGYILKLNHMVEDKTHARSTGPYSLVTQQPLGGKAQMGGQRLGEMEVWALEAHKAAATLQEMLTLKSDDIVGRSQAFEAIVKGTEIPASTIPESFKVLVKELNSLGLAVTPIQPIGEQSMTTPEDAPSHVSSNVIVTAEDLKDSVGEVVAEDLGEQMSEVDSLEETEATEESEEEVVENN
jgi:DNA-directed RNA polymerase subunit beta